MLNKKILHNQNFLIIILILFSLSINQIYGNKGVFPLRVLLISIQPSEFYKAMYPSVITGPYQEYLLITYNPFF